MNLILWGNFSRLRDLALDALGSRLDGRTLEPFALDLWRHELEHWLPQDANIASVEEKTLFGGLYQLLRITV